MKNGLGNLAATNVDQLAAIVKNRLKGMQYRPALIDAFLAQPGSPSNSNRRRPQPFNLCSACGRRRRIRPPRRAAGRPS
jgi:hypothetical protein